MTQPEKHTPWRVELRYIDGFTVYDVNNDVVFDDGSASDEYQPTCTRERAAVITKAVNSHAKLLEALEKIAEPDIGEEKISWRTHALEARDIARAAIADAEGEEGES